MLASRLGGALANRTTLSIVLAASIIIGALSVQLINISSELANNSKTIQLQNKEIEDYQATIASQKEEIESKIIQLEALNTEIAAKSREAENLSSELSAQGAELAMLQEQAQRLEGEIAALQSKIKSDEQYVASLSKQLELTQQSAKRIKISHYSLAVINGEKGIVFPIELEIINSGTGAISVDVGNVQYEDSFQRAVRTAATVASDYTGQSISDKDIIVKIIDDQLDSELATIDGGSAGALVAAMMVAGLTDMEVNDKVLVTGTINPNGTVGRVGSLKEKTDAALDVDATVLLVPESQEFDSDRIAVVGVLDIEEVVKYLLASR